FVVDFGVGAECGGGFACAAVSAHEDAVVNREGDDDERVGSGDPGFAEFVPGFVDEEAAEHNREERPERGNVELGAPLEVKEGDDHRGGPCAPGGNAGGRTDACGREQEEHPEKMSEEIPLVRRHWCLRVNCAQRTRFSDRCGTNRAVDLSGGCSIVPFERGRGGRTTPLEKGERL